MSVFLSPVFGAGAQVFTNQGVVNALGKIYCYVAGTTTLQDTWTDATGLVKNSNPIILDSAGRTPQEIWFLGGVNYKLVVTDASGNTLGLAWDNLTGINDTSSTLSQWQASGVVPGYASTTSFTAAGDKTSTFQVGRRIQATISASTVYATIKTSVYSSGTTTVTLLMDTANLDAGLSNVNVGVITPRSSSLSTIGIAANASPLLVCQLSADTAAAANINPIKFTAADTDTWGAYVPATGLFTAPIAGTYAMALTINYTTSLAATVWGAIQIAGSISRSQYSVATWGAATTQSFSTYFVYRLAAGDTVSAFLAASAGTVLAVAAPNGGSTRGTTLIVNFLGS